VIWSASDARIILPAPQMATPRYEVEFTATFSTLERGQPTSWAYTMVMVPISVYLNELLIQDEQRIRDVPSLACLLWRGKIAWAGLD
jgi:hypothetical protein